MSDNNTLGAEAQRRMMMERATALYGKAACDPKQLLNAANAVIGECAEIDYNGRTIAPSQPVVRALLIDAFNPNGTGYDKEKFGVAFHRAIQLRIEIACIEQAMQEVDLCG